jgi:glucokinase
LPSTGRGVLALDIGATKIAAGVGTDDGEISRQTGAPTRAAEGAEAVLERAIALARGCYQAELTSGRQLEALGVSSMGLTFESHVELSPNVPGWHQLRIPEALEVAFPGLPIVIGNDVRVAARAEMNWGSLQGVEDAIYFNLGSGIAAGIVSGGRLLSGAHGAAGEVGYTLFRGLPEKRLASDGLAPFEDWFGGAGAARRLATMGLPSSMAELVERQQDDPAARAFIEETWTGIGVMAANLCIALDPTVVSLGGGYLRGDSGIVEHIQASLALSVPYPPKVVRARFGGDAALRGAAALALADLGAPR